MSYLDGPRGVGGWLALFLLAIGLFSPATAVFGLLSTMYGNRQLEVFYGPSWSALLTAEWTLVAISLLGCWAIVWRMMFVFRWSSVIFAVVGIWCVGVAASLVEVLIVGWIAGVPLGKMANGLGPELIRPIVFDTVWTAYLLKSQRVANTYPRHSEDEAVSEVFE